ncbi:hypothetical protein [Cellulomonas gilvus]|uniref:Uncharacterized protein n=1 Tax=Cellulomonas gilvus (strain ATCC 13127 / NRRL B-14078) TaxID=593907 RepID=F8A2F1_CELGA|nr:hypothetical protein [Cellulomonas gilvus]AEI11808.1 hypothetical protein Celgi_1289 [Cellulomonas gilvus ATCC 13127]
MPAPTGSSLTVPGSPATPGPANGFKKYFADLWTYIDGLISGIFPLGSGTWVAYTPTTNITLSAPGGGGSITGRYTQIGKTIRGRVDFTLGSGFVFPSDPQISVPVTALSARIDASGTCRPAGSAEYVLTASSLNASTFRPRSPGTAGLLTSLSASVPAAWAAGGWGWLEFEYEIP